MERRDYTPTKLSQLTHLTNVNASNRINFDRNHSPLQYSRPELTHTPDYTHKSITPDYTHKSVAPDYTEVAISKDYDCLKLQVRQMQAQNRQLSNDIEKFSYQKNINENKHMQKVSYEEEAITQFQKEKNYQIELIKIKNDEGSNKLKREYEFKLDDLTRELRGKDYHNRELTEKTAYLELKTNELNKGIEILESEHQKFRETNRIIEECLNQEEFKQKKMMSITEELEKQKCEMETQIYVLLDIEAEKSRTINTVEIQLRNSETNERSLHQKLGALTDNFGSLEEHIAIMKERLISTDVRNEELENALQHGQFQLSEKDNTMMSQKELEQHLRKELEIHQQREMHRERQIEELVIENQRLVVQLNGTRQKLQERCLAQGIEI